MMSNNNIRIIDLFFGAGGLSYGFEQKECNFIFANEMDKDCSVTYQNNHRTNNIICADIGSLNPEKIRNDCSLKKGELDLIIGGPPCQGFSTYGKRDPNDPRNLLYRRYLDFVWEFQPKIFVIENVLGILSMKKGQVIEDIRNLSSEHGYNIDVHILNAADYGVPQNRKRVIIFGNRLGLKIPAPEQTHSIDAVNDLFSKKLKHRTVRDAISDLPESVFPPKMIKEKMSYTEKPLNDYQQFMRENTIDLHNHSAKRMMAIRKLRLLLLKPGDYGREIRNRINKGGLSKTQIDSIFNPTENDAFIGCRKQDQAVEIKLKEMLSSGTATYDDIVGFLDAGGFANKYRRLDWDNPSHTLVAHMSRDCSDFVHPEYDRFISVREAARLQSFPDDFQFHGSQFSQLKQIGNAVPPLLSISIANHILNILENVTHESIKATDLTYAENFLPA